MRKLRHVRINYHRLPSTISMNFIQSGNIGKYDLSGLLLTIVAATSLLSIAQIATNFFMSHLATYRNWYKDARYERTIDFSFMREFENSHKTEKELRVQGFDPEKDAEEFEYPTEWPQEWEKREMLEHQKNYEQQLTKTCWPCCRRKSVLSVKERKVRLKKRLERTMLSDSAMVLTAKVDVLMEHAKRVQNALREEAEIDLCFDVQHPRLRRLKTFETEDLELVRQRRAAMILTDRNDEDAAQERFEAQKRAEDMCKTVSVSMNGGGSVEFGWIDEDGAFSRGVPEDLYSPVEIRSIGSQETLVGPGRLYDLEEQLRKPTVLEHVLGKSSKHTPFEWKGLGWEADVGMNSVKIHGLSPLQRQRKHQQEHQQQLTHSIIREHQPINDSSVISYGQSSQTPLAETAVEMDDFGSSPTSDQLSSLQSAGDDSAFDVTETPPGEPEDEEDAESTVYI